MSEAVSSEWTVEGSPYIVMNGANVPQRETLRILPGVEVILRHTSQRGSNAFVDRG